MSSEPTRPAPDTPPADIDRPSASSTSSPWGRTLLAGAAGLLAGVIAFPVIQGIGEVFQVPPEIAALNVGIPGAEDQAKIAASRLEQLYRNSALWLAAVGAILGVLVGLTTRTPKSSALWGGGIGAIIAGVAGPIAIGFDQWAQNNVPAGELTVPEYYIIMMHGMTWLIVGAGVGLGVGVATPGSKAAAGMKTAASAAVAGLLGGILFPVVAALVHPSLQTALAIPDAEFRWGYLLWLCLPMTLIGLAIGRTRATAVEPAAPPVAKS